MSDDSWREVEALFAAALSLPAPERAALLDARCAGRPALRREVESLLDSHAELDGFLDVRGATLAEAAAGAALDRSGETIGGRYRLLEKIAAGRSASCCSRC